MLRFGRGMCQVVILFSFKRNTEVQVCTVLWKVGVSNSVGIEDMQMVVHIEGGKLM